MIGCTCHSEHLASSIKVRQALRVACLLDFALVCCNLSIYTVAMSVQPLNDLWEAAAGQPYEPTIGKNSQFTVGITLLFAGMRQ